TGLAATRINVAADQNSSGSSSDPIISLPPIRCRPKLTANCMFLIYVLKVNLNWFINSANSDWNIAE
ncbi:MAG TPA: hypothetical protein VFL97_05065, partial [Nitrococcus sp.]|nr:hypothetical protein [Nitrococcus sp.]